MRMDKATRLFIILGGFFIANTLLAEFVGVKIFSLEATFGFNPNDWTLFGVTGLGFNLTAGVLLWPVVFVMTDIINEYYGKRGVKLLSGMAIGLVLYSFAMIYLSIWLEPNGWWKDVSGQVRGVDNMDVAYNSVFGQGLWIIIGSMVAFLVGQILDVTVFHRLKRITGESKIWLRATGSTLVSQFVDSFVVLIVAFYIGSDWDLWRVLAIGMVNYTYKFVLAIGLTPVLYWAHAIIDRYLGDEEASRLKLLAGKS